MDIGINQNKRNYRNLKFLIIDSMSYITALKNKKQF